MKSLSSYGGFDKLQNVFITDRARLQREAAEWLQSPFAILSDEALQVTTAMKLPTFRVESMTLLNGSRS